MDSENLKWKRPLRNWRCEQAPSMDGPWLTADAADGSASIAIAPPGTAITGREEEHCERWRLAWWTADAGEDLLGVPPTGEVAISLEDVVSLMPRRIARRALAWQHAAQEKRPLPAIEPRATRAFASPESG